MIMGIRQEIKDVAIEAIELSFKMGEVADENFMVHTSIPKKLNKATVTIQALKRPFPVTKFPLIQKAIGGKFAKARTNENFAKVTQLRHSGVVCLVLNFYFKECLNPASRDKVQVQKGIRGRVLTPELCDGAEFAIMRGLGIKEPNSESLDKFVEE